MNTEIMELKVEDFASIFGAKVQDMPQECIDIIKNNNFKYREANQEEREKMLLRATKILFEDLSVSGPGRKGDWEKGWKENYNDFTLNNYETEKLIPKFVREREWIRMRGNYILPEDGGFETSFVTVLRIYIFSKFFPKYKSIFEFGCGTGLNLLAMATLFPKKTLYGLDWVKSSCDIVNSLAKTQNINAKGSEFDMFNPDYELQIGSGDAVFTTGAMEQLGVNFNMFLDYLITKKVGICVHFETMMELYDQDNIFDFIAAKYLEKRGYLNGFLKQLKIYEKNNKVEIIEVRKTFGSFYHDGYSVIVWRPV